MRRIVLVEEDCNHNYIYDVPGELLNAINSDFGSLEKLQNMLSTAAVGVQGSGWAWLGLNPQTKKLQIAACANQDPLQPTTGEFLFYSQ